MSHSRSSEPAGSRREFFKTALQFDDPAFLRRAKSVEESWRSLQRVCRAKRVELLEITLVRLAILAALIDGRWRSLDGLIADSGQADELQRWYEELQPELRQQVEPSPSPSRWKRALKELNVSAEYFNRHWLKFLEEVDLTQVNAVREGYNKYYVIEKSCAFDSECLGRMDFEPLGKVTQTELAQYFPLFPIVELRN